jgi:hypothetical protein
MVDAPAVNMDRAQAHVLLKQGLTGDGLASVMDAVVASGGIYSTAPTCYLSCAARVASFKLADLDAELYERRSLARHRSVRGMAYIEPLEALPAILATSGGETRERTLTRISKWTELSEPEVLAFADEVEAVLEGQPPMTVPEIRKVLGADLPGNRNTLQFTVALLGRFARIVRTRPRGSWRSDLYGYQRWTEWFGAPLEEADPDTAGREVARRYLRAYGPATAADLAWWSGWTKRDSVAALAALEDEVVAVTLEGRDPQSAGAWVLADELDALTSVDAKAARGVRLLPVWDAYFMGYEGSSAARARQVAPEDYPRIYDKTGNGTSTVIEDGMAAGVWELDVDAGAVTVAPFGKLRWKDVEAQVAALSAAIDAPLRLERADPPGLLSDGPRNAFLSPISLRPASAEAEE